MRVAPPMRNEGGAADARGCRDCRVTCADGAGWHEQWLQVCATAGFRTFYACFLGRGGVSL